VTACGVTFMYQHLALLLLLLLLCCSCCLRIPFYASRWVGMDVDAYILSAEGDVPRQCAIRNSALL
jgi:hypothetical protein